MNRAEFASKIKSHDWYYGYSDDHSVWQRGHKAAANLRRAQQELSCPFTMSELQTWAHNMILEQFAEEEPGCWYRQPRKYKSVAPAKREELIPQSLHDEITHWMSLGATAEEISRFVG